MKRYFTYDLETYPNCFTFCGKFNDSDNIYLYELSDRMNQRDELVTFLSYLRNVNVEMVGFNNVGFDYPIIHELMINPYTFDYVRAAQICQTIINSQRTNIQLKRIKYSERIIPQIDMMKICHFDNVARSTSLKALQFAMRSESLEDLPFDIRDLNDQEKDVLKQYNIHDVIETEKFFLKNKHHLDMRREYLEEGILRGDVLNYNDVKIGVEYLITRIGHNKCFSGNKPKQTMRESITFSNIILPKIHFRTEPFQEVHSWFMQQRVYMTSPDRPKLKANLGGVDFHFGVGGLHASVENKIYESNDEYAIIDIDVASMYPSVAIANNFGPEHLGQTFIEVYKQIKSDRLQYAKGTSRNAAMKLAGNGAYGNFNNPYSPLYDPRCLYQITINGQLQLLQLVEMISLIPDMEIIQGNTDGITMYMKREYKYLFDMWCKVWEEMTGLDLEEIEYSRMWIRDVNNYISESKKGLKRKGAYWYPTNDKEYDGWWNKDFSNLASKIAVEKVLTHSWPLEIALRLITNPFDFMLRYKVPRGSHLYIGDVKQLKTVRYYVSTSGEPMKKVSPPKGEAGEYKRANKLTDVYFNKVMSEIGKGVWDDRIHSKNKSKYVTRETSVQSGWKVKQCNVASDFNWNDVDWNYYKEESKKIIIGSK